MNIKNKMKIPLSLITVGFGIGFFDGMFGLGLSEDLYIFAGIFTLIGIIWAWVILLKSTPEGQ